MGYYLDLPEATNKASQLKQTHGAKLLAQRPTWFQIDQNLDEGVVTICVVKNAAFEAAGIITNRYTYLRYTEYPGDHRPRVWLTISSRVVADLNPAAMLDIERRGEGREYKEDLR